MSSSAVANRDRCKEIAMRLVMPMTYSVYTYHCCYMGHSRENACKAQYMPHKHGGFGNLAKVLCMGITGSDFVVGHLVISSVALLVSPAIL